MDTNGAPSQPPQQQEPRKKRKHRGGKRKKNRRQSFAAPPSEAGTDVPSAVDGLQNDPLAQVPEDGRSDFYRMRSNFSDESLESEALLDHRYGSDSTSEMDVVC